MSHRSYRSHQTEVELKPHLQLLGVAAWIGSHQTEVELKLLGAPGTLKPLAGSHQTEVELKQLKAERDAYAAFVPIKPKWN